MQDLLKGGDFEIALDIATNRNYLGTFDYYFNNGNSSVAPYLGAGLGIYSLAAVGFNVSADIEDPFNIEDSFTIVAKSEFGGMIRGGIELGKFRLGVEYNIIPKTDLGDGISAKNSYFGASLGFYIGGGRW